MRLSGFHNTSFFANKSERSVVIIHMDFSHCWICRVGLSKRAVELFFDMHRESIRLSGLIVILARPSSMLVLVMGHWRTARKCTITSGKSVCSLPVSNALMDMYAKIWKHGRFTRVFSFWPSKDIVSWNTMIGDSKNGFPNEALNLFVEMQSKFKRDNVTISCILPACASLATLNKGREIHVHILRNELSLDCYIMNVLVDMYVKFGVLVLASIATFRKMQHEGLEPGEVSFTSILYACGHSGLIDQGWRFYDISKYDYKIEPKLEHYACMVDLLS